MDKELDEQNVIVEESNPPIVQDVAVVPQPQRGNIVARIAVLCVIAICAGVVLFIETRSPKVPNPQKPSDTPYLQKIADSAKTIVPKLLPESSKKPQVSPVPSPEQTTVEDILKNGDYHEKTIQFKNNDGPTVDKSGLSIKIPGQQSTHLIRPAGAEEMESLVPIYIQNPTVETLDGIAAKLGIQAKATRPESNKLFYLTYIDPDAKLVYEPSAGSLFYETTPGQGDLPSFAKAEELAKDLANKLGLSLDSRQIKVVESSLSSQYENYASIHPAVAVNIMQQKGGTPIVYSDVDHIVYGPDGASLSPEISILITGGNKITRFLDVGYAHHLGDKPVAVDNRNLEKAIEELKTYGGHIRNTVQLEDQRSHFACADNKCTVHDAVITKGYRGYYWNDAIGSLSYAEINDNLPRAFDYLTPVWIFEGTGLMDKAKIDESGRLIPNIDKTNNDEYYAQKVKFTATVPGFAKPKDTNILQIKNYTTTLEENDQVKVSFETHYLFPTFPGGSFSQAEPRFGVKYRLLVLFPDKTYSVINGYKQEVYPGEITFDIGDAKGEITMYLELADFSNLIEKRTLRVE